MRKWMFFLLLASLLASMGVMTGCKSDGSREFIPGQGWRKI